MSKPVCSIFPKSVTWNSVTWDANLVGPLRMDISHMGREIEDRTGDDMYPRSTIYVDPSVRVTLVVRQFKHTLAMNVKSNMVYTFTDTTGATATVTLTSMVFGGVRMSQDRATQGSAELTFTHESVDGHAAPFA